MHGKPDEIQDWTQEGASVLTYTADNGDLTYFHCSSHNNAKRAIVAHEAAMNQLFAHAEALAEACKAGLKFLACAMDNRENQAAFRRQLQAALAQWEGVRP